MNLDMVKAQVKEKKVLVYRIYSSNKRPTISVLYFLTMTDLFNKFNWYVAKLQELTKRTAAT